MASLPPKLQALRQAHTFACLSHFLHTFTTAIKLPELSISNVEDDLTGDGTHVLPTLIARLLIIMTHDKKITHDNFEGYFRRQFTRRVSYKQNPLGHEDEPIHWEDVDMMDKLDVLFHLCEWQFSGAGRLRAMMGEVNDLAWRLEPIGQDSEKNTYWLIGGDRLWVQHPDPNPPPPRKRRRRLIDAASSSKAATNKPSTKTGGSKRATTKLNSTLPRRGRPPKAPRNAPLDKKSKSTTRTRGHPRSPSPASDAFITASRTRSGAHQVRTAPARPMRSAAVAANANIRKRPLQPEYFEDDLDEVEEASEEQSLPRSSKRVRTGTSTPMSSSAPPATRGRSTRNSRLRNHDEWQQIPDEWLNSGAAVPPAGDTDDEESTGTGAHGGDDSVAPPNGDDLDEQKKTRSHPRRIVSPSSSPEPASNPVAALPASDTIFGDDESDLTDLTEEDGRGGAVLCGVAEPKDLDDDGKQGELDAQGETLGEEGSQEGGEETSTEDDEIVDEEYAIRIAASQPKHWVEWETVCVTLDEWEVFPKQFEDSTSMKERALYKALVTISETVITEIKEVIRHSQKEEAATIRKRSTRLLAIEKQAEAEAVERRQKHDELEARGRELRQAKREQTRAERAAEREERLRQKELEATLEAQREEGPIIAATRPPVDNEYIDVTSTGRPARAATSKASATTNGTAPKKKAPARSTWDEEWELDCEICGETGVNVKESGEITCCDICGKWQHVDCHNRADAEAGRPLRNWSVVHFMCDDCDRPARRPKKSTRSNRSQRVNADGRPSGIPGPQPALRTTSRINHRAPVPLPAPVNVPNHLSYQLTWNSQAPGGMLPSSAQFVPLYQQPPQRPYSSPHPSASYPPNLMQSPARPMEYTHIPAPAVSYTPPPARYATHSQLPISPSHPAYPVQPPYPNYHQSQYSAHSSSQPGHNPVVTPNPVGSSLPPLTMPNYNAGPQRSQAYASYYGSPNSSRSPYTQNGPGSDLSPVNQYATVNGLQPTPIADYARTWDVGGSPQYAPHSPYTNGRPAEYLTQNGQYQHGSQAPIAPVAQYNQHHSHQGPYPSPHPNQPQLPPLQRPPPARGHNGSPSIPSRIPDLTHHRHPSHSESPRPSLSTPTSMHETSPPPALNGLHAAPRPLQATLTAVLDGSAFANGLPGGGTTTTASGRVDHWTRNAKGVLVHMPGAYHNPADVISQPIPPEPPKPRKPAQRAPRPPVEPLGPNQHFAGSFRAQPIGGSSTGMLGDDHTFPGGRGRDGSRQHVYQPPPTKPRMVSQPGSAPCVIEGGSGLDNLSALAEAAHAQSHLVRSATNSD